MWHCLWHPYTYERTIILRILFHIRSLLIGSSSASTDLSSSSPGSPSPGVHPGSRRRTANGSVASSASSGVATSGTGAPTGAASESSLAMRHLREIETWIFRLLSAPVPVPGTLFVRCISRPGRSRAIARRQTHLDPRMQAHFFACLAASVCSLLSRVQQLLFFLSLCRERSYCAHNPDCDRYLYESLLDGGEND